jgi:uncharacterized protein (DUF1684 family)
MLAAMALTLLDWRRRVARLYADVRSASTPVEGHDIWRAGRDRLFAEHPDSPLEPADRARFAGLPITPYDPSLRFDVELDTDVEPTGWQVPTDGDGVVPFSRLGVAHLPGLGDLDVWWLESYGGGVFVPVRDTAADTYGGGRYLLDTVKGADLGGNAAAGHLVLDLNFAYNPSCAYSPAWTCPLAPAGNTLTIPLPGGERVRAAAPEAE